MADQADPGRTFRAFMILAVLARVVWEFGTDGWGDGAAMIGLVGLTVLICDKPKAVTP